MQIDQQLYQYLIQNEFEKFCACYENEPEGSLYNHHRKLIATAHIKENIPAKDNRYQKFIYYLLDKHIEEELVASVIAQGGDNKYLKAYIAKNPFLIDDCTYDAAIRYKNVEAFSIALPHVNLGDVTKSAFSINFPEGQMLLANTLPITEIYNKLVIEVFLKSITNYREENFFFKPYLHFFSRQDINIQNLLEDKYQEAQKKVATFKKFYDNIKGFTSRYNSNFFGKTSERPEWHEHLFSKPSHSSLDYLNPHDKQEKIDRAYEAEKIYLYLNLDKNIAMKSGSKVKKI